MEQSASHRITKIIVKNDKKNVLKTEMNKQITGFLLCNIDSNFHLQNKKKTNWMRNNRNEYTNNTSNKNRETESRKKRKRQVKNGSVSSNMGSHMSECTYRHTYLTWASRNPSNKFTLTRNAVIQYFYLFSILSLLIFKWMQLRWCERVLRRARLRVCFFSNIFFLTVIFQSCFSCACNIHIHCSRTYLVKTDVWINFFACCNTPQPTRLDASCRLCMQTANKSDVNKTKMKSNKTKTYKTYDIELLQIARLCITWPVAQISVSIKFFYFLIVI